MNTKEFIAKFPATTTINEDRLHDIACPECGQRDRIRIKVEGYAEVSEDTVTPEGDYEWDGDSHAQCPKCNHYGMFASFRIDGLDEWLADEAEEQEAHGND